jgi:hypothetical protein
LVLVRVLILPWFFDPVSAFHDDKAAERTEGLGSSHIASTAVRVDA